MIYVLLRSWRNANGYDRFAELYGGGQAVDRVRNQNMPLVGPTLDYLDEAFTSENWIVSSLRDAVHYHFS